MLVFDPLKLSMLDYKLSFGSYIFKTPFLLPNILWSSHCDRVHMWSWLKVWHTDHTGLWPSVSHMPFGVVTLRDRSLSSAMLLEVKLPVCLKFTASTGLYLSTVSLKPIKLQSATRECSYRCQQCMSAPMAASNTWVLPWLHHFSDSMFSNFNFVYMMRQPDLPFPESASFNQTTGFPFLFLLLWSKVVHIVLVNTWKIPHDTDLGFW